MSKQSKAKRNIESRVDRDQTIEANYYARKCGLTREEALKILKQACVVKAWPNRDRAKAPLPAPTLSGI
ncbi:hypothetical protein B5V01_07830 [Mesorhizobium erdmanii]|uniref:DUF3606 domain-containing protein n=2 Tax=Mesorhizobium TaxID=68287 RepID=A0A3M9X3J3_9HYPH|nr:hypothetical protein DNR46_29135 [Mesorhizobium japonicum]RXT47988.1 hypothetical protein B5V01_07830 [Mesorhizobium erdmanii]